MPQGRVTGRASGGSPTSHGPRNRPLDGARTCGHRFPQRKITLDHRNHNAGLRVFHLAQNDQGF